MDKLMELIERLEKAEGPDRELDAEIHRAVDPDCSDMILDGAAHGWLVGGDHSLPVKAPRYTGSLDAALSLVPPATQDCLPFWRIGNDGEGANPADFKAELLLAGRLTSPAYRAVAASAPLALCIAALKARRS